MRVVVQRVGRASVVVDSNTVGEIGSGIVILLGISVDDTESNAEKMVEKVLNLRVFNDEEGKMNLSCLDVGGDALVISQFTLYGDCKKGRRPSYARAAGPDKAHHLYEYFVSKMMGYPLKVQTGVFGAMMTVELANEGPVTLIVET